MSRGSKGPPCRELHLVYSPGFLQTSNKICFPSKQNHGVAKSTTVEIECFSENEVLKEQIWTKANEEQCSLIFFFHQFNEGSLQT